MKTPSKTTTPAGTTCSRAPDFAETHEYVVTFADGAGVRIFRDTDQFSHALWHITGDESSLGIGYSKADALETLDGRQARKVAS